MIIYGDWSGSFPETQSGVAVVNTDLSRAVQGGLGSVTYIPELVGNINFIAAIK